MQSLFDDEPRNGTYLVRCEVCAQLLGRAAYRKHVEEHHPDDLERLVRKEARAIKRGVEEAIRRAAERHKR